MIAVPRRYEMSQLRDGDHLAFAYSDSAHRRNSIVEFVRGGVLRNQLNLLLVRSDTAKEYLAYLREEGVPVGSLVDSGALVFITIDGLIEKRDSGAIANEVSCDLECLSRSLRVRGRSGLNIIGEIAGNLVKAGRYEDALLIELFWHLTIPKSDIPITLICPYESIPHELAQGLQEVHSCPLFIEHIWEIRPADYACARCHTRVKNEIRIYEPRLIAGQALVVSAAMRTRAAGWIPFCYDCLHSHRFLRPLWLVDEMVPKRQGTSV
jgi:hypothetical protein